MDNINKNLLTGEYSMFSVKEKPWHDHAKILSKYPTSAEALQFAGLDYKVEKRNLFTYDNENEKADADNEIKIPEIQVPDYFATVRTDTEQVLGVVGKNYQVVQNVEAFSFFDAIVNGEGIQYETAGALGKGERIFICAKLPSYIKVSNEDVIEKYLFLTTSHDGSGSILAAFTPIRIVCNNTLNAAMRNHSNAVRIKHTANAKEKLVEAHKIMGMVNTLSPLLELTFETWAKTTIVDEQVRKLIQIAMCPNKETFESLRIGKEDETSAMFKKICDRAFEYTMTAPSQQLETTKGTLYGAYNGITGYFQNVQSYKNSESKIDSLLFGGIAQTRTQRAFNNCTAFYKYRGDALPIFN